MKKILFGVLGVLLASFTLEAQTKQLTIEDYNNKSLQPKMLHQLSWRGETDWFTYVNDSASLVQGVLKDPDVKVLLTLKELNEKMTAAGLESRKSFPAITWRDSLHFTFTDKQSMIQYDFETKGLKKVAEWEEGAENHDVGPAGHVAFTKDGNLFIYNVTTKKLIPVSKDGSHDLVYGESVHRNEFGITKGTFWSPKGTKLAFYRMDQSMVTDYWLPDYSKVPAEGKFIKYPMAGSKSHHVKVGVYDLATGKVTYLMTGEPAEQYLTNVTWSPDEQFIYIAVLNRDQNDMKLNRYDVKTGSFNKTILEEKDPRYVEPEHGPYFNPKKPDEFIWFSKRNAFNHLYLFNVEGKMIKQLSNGAWNVDEFLGFSNDGNNIYFTGNMESPLDHHFMTIFLNNDFPFPLKLTYESGYHRFMVNKRGTHFIGIFQGEKMPGITRVQDATNGSITNVLLSSDNPLRDYDLGSIIVFPLKSKDSQVELYCRMILPTNFNYQKRYPVLYYLYGGPHAQLVQNKWLAGADLFLLYMASQGYVVFTLDNRGSSNRGSEFEMATFRNLGTVEMEDQMVGVDYLKRQDFVDSTRMGVFGWSFGGFMATSMMLRKPGVFKTGVAGGPVMDWNMYEIMYTERYMDTPQANPDGYAKASLFQYIPNLKGKLMLLHGQKDDVVLPQHTQSFINECIAKGVLVDYFPFPNHAHNVRGKDRVFMYKKIADFFDRNLK